jgi:hypothetical protein
VSARVTILDAVDNANLFAPWFREPATWVTWRAFLAALFALKMSSEQLAIYQHCTGRSAPPTRPATEAWLDDARLLTQLVGLERRTRGGRDSIDHAPDAHDDLANAVAGLAGAARGESYRYDSNLDWVNGSDPDKDFQVAAQPAHPANRRLLPKEMAMKNDEAYYDKTVHRESGERVVDRLFTGHAAQVMATFPDRCIDLVVTSCPYWTAVEYDQGKSPWPSYDAILATCNQSGTSALAFCDRTVSCA